MITRSIQRNTLRPNLMIFDYSDTTLLGPYKMVSQMREEWLLTVLTFLASAFWWCPICVEPSLNLPAWIPVVLVFLWTGFATILSGGRWFRIVLACTLGSIAGMATGFVTFPTSDGIIASYEPFATGVAAVVLLVISLIAALIARQVSVFLFVQREGLRRALGVLLCFFFALGPISLALTPPLVNARIKRNDRAAEARFIALKRAVEASAFEARNLDRMCDGSLLKRHYSGPQFSDSDWQYIAGNYVKQDGYVFGIWCNERSRGYTIDAYPKETVGYGSRRFCADESGKIGCGADWNDSREACVPCAK